MESVAVRNHFPFPSGRENFVPVADQPLAGTPDPGLSSVRDLDFYRRHLALPWCRQGGALVVAAADTSSATLLALRTRYGGTLRVRRIARPALLRALEVRFADALLEEATTGLLLRYPEFSARRVITAGQAVALSAMPVAIALTLLFAPRYAGFGLAVALGVAYVANALFRALLVWVGAGRTDRPEAAWVHVAERELPLYSIIVPLYHEANVVPGLVAAIGALDYPADRLEVVLALEADDHETIAAAMANADSTHFSILRVPPRFPRTKPKAANYAMGFVHGEFTVIYDAEDRPEPDQLRKAVAAFRSQMPAVACLQARLNFYNAQENWLTRGIMAQTPPA